MAKPTFTIRFLLLVTAASCAALACLTWYVQHERKSFFMSCRASLVQFGFQVYEKDSLMAIDGANADVPAIGGSEAIEIATVSQRYRFEISNCKITDQAMEILLAFNHELAGIQLKECEVVPEKHSAVRQNPTVSESVAENEP